MAWFDEPAKYYRAVDQAEPLNQGDIVVAPTTIIYPGSAGAEIAGPADLAEVRHSTLWLAGGDTLPAAPAFSAETRWGLALVIPHPCAMEKEWNERVTELRQAGHELDDAKRMATEDEALDPFISLAPILPMDTVPQHRRAGIKVNQRLGNFPVCGQGAIPEAFVDFNQISTAHYTAVPRRRRVAALSDLAIAHLHHSLVMHVAYRGYSGLTELERAIGELITDVAVTPRAKGKLVVNFILESGKTLTLESQDSSKSDALVVERPARN